MEIEYSRAMRLGAAVTNAEPEDLKARLANSSVVVSLDPSAPGAELCARILLTTLRRLPGTLFLRSRGVPSHVVDSLVAAAAEVDPSRPVRVDTTDGERGTCRVHVGPVLEEQAIRIVPEGCGACVASDPAYRITPARGAHALGAVYGAALAAGEVFKVVADVLPERGARHPVLRFCPVCLSESPCEAPVEAELELRLALVGVGAVGTGVALVLSECATRGDLLLVDPQQFAAENVGTYSLGGRRDAERSVPKVKLAERVLGKFRCISFQGRVEDAIERIDAGRLPWHRTVITALDDRDVRHEAQRLWPDRLIDAGTGDTMLGILDAVHGTGACLMCHLPRGNGRDSLKSLSALTGLSEARLARGTEDLVAGDLQGLAPEKLERLRPHLGKPVCGLAEAFGLTNFPAVGYRPAVPFVSLQAACLAVGRLLGAAVGRGATANRVQYDALVGPQRGIFEAQAPIGACYCRQRWPTIDEIRRRRAQLRASP